MSVRKIRNRSEVSGHSINRELAGNNLRGTTTKVKAKIKAIYHPGDENPKGFEYLNTNIIRAMVELSNKESDFEEEINGWVFPYKQTRSYLA